MICTSTGGTGTCADGTGPKMAKTGWSPRRAEAMRSKTRKKVSVTPNYMTNALSLKAKLSCVGQLLHVLAGWVRQFGAPEGSPGTQKQVRQE